MNTRNIYGMLLCYENQAIIRREITYTQTAMVISLWFRVLLAYSYLVQLLSTKIVHFYDKSMNLCQITTNPKTNNSGYGAKPNSTLDTNTAQALKWPT